MKETNCEEIMMLKIAEFDGGMTVSSESANAHLISCENCRKELAEMQITVSLLQTQKRFEQSVDLWQAIEQRIEISSKKESPIKWQWFVSLGALLIVYKLLEMIPESAPGFYFRFVPVALVVALFIFLRENPFKIKTEAILES